MPNFTQTNQQHPGYMSDMLVGEDNYVADRLIDAGQSIAKGDILVRDGATGNWRINDGWSADSPDTDTVGVALEDAATGASQTYSIAVLVKGQVRAADVNGLPAGYGAGSHLGLIILE